MQHDGCVIVRSYAGLPIPESTDFSALQHNTLYFSSGYLDYTNTGSLQIIFSCNA